MLSRCHLQRLPRFIHSGWPSGRGKLDNTPRRARLGHAHDQVLDFRRDGRTARLTTRVRPFLRDELTVPSEKRIRGDQSGHFREEFLSKLFPLRREPSTLLVASRRFSSLKRNRVLPPLSVSEMTLRSAGNPETQVGTCDPRLGRSATSQPIRFSLDCRLYDDATPSCAKTRPLEIADKSAA